MKRLFHIFCIAVLLLCFRTDSATAGFPIITFGGDLSGTYASQTVLKVNGTTVPSAPAANNVLTATNSTSASWVSPQLQTSVTPVFPFSNLQTHKSKWLNGETPTGSSTSPTAGQQYAGWSTLTFNNVNTTPAFSSASLLGATKRLHFQSAAATAFVGLNETGYVNAGITQWGVWRGNAAGRGGFFLRIRFSITSIGVSSTMNAFCGLLDGVAQQAAGTNYTTETASSKLGIGFTATTTAGGAFPAANWQAIQSDHNTPTLTDLGSNFALTLNDFIEMNMFCPQQGTTVSVQVNNLTTSTTNTVSLNSTLPLTTRLLALQCVFGVQTITSGTDAMDISLVYLEDFDG